MTPSAALEHPWLLEGVIWVAELDTADETDNSSGNSASPRLAVHQQLGPQSGTGNYEYGPIPVVHIQTPTRTIAHDTASPGSDFLLAAMLKSTHVPSAEAHVPGQLDELDAISGSRSRPRSTEQANVSHAALFVSLFGPSSASCSFTQL